MLCAGFFLCPPLLLVQHFFLRRKTYTWKRCDLPLAAIKRRDRRGVKGVWHFVPGFMPFCHLFVVFSFFFFNDSLAPDRVQTSLLTPKSQGDLLAPVPKTSNTRVELCGGFPQGINTHGPRYERGRHVTGRYHLFDREPRLHHTKLPDPVTMKKRRLQIHLSES